jgi:hypothetical protein
MANKNFYKIDSDDKLFCKCDGTTTTFVDSSTANPKTITANGNATQLSLHADFAGKRTAGFFNGTTDYVVVPDSADWDFGNGAYRVDVYVNQTTATGNQAILGRNSTSEFLLQVESGVPKLYTGVGGGTLIITSSQTLTANTWNKISVVRTGTGTNQTTLLVNDANGVNGTDSFNYSSSSNLAIGITKDSSGGNYFSGWMKNLTITKAGTTVLDMKFDSPATSPLGPAIYFDGTGDALSVPNGGSFDVADGVFTVEAFLRPVVTTNLNFTLFDSGVDSNKGIAVRLSPNASNAASVFLNGSAVINAVTLGMNSLQSNHIAVERYNGRLKLFVNGVQKADVADTTNITANSAVATYIGAQGGSTQTMPMYLRELRFSNVARYSGAAFTPSQTGFTVDSNTKLYIKGDENNGVTTFVDSETTPKTVTTAGDTKIKYTEDYRSCIFKDDSASAHKPYPVGSAKVDFFSAFGSGVGYFDGTNDYLSIPDHEDWDFGTGTFTAEVYVRWSTVGTASILYRGAKNWGLEYAAGHLYWYAETATINDGTWTPIVNTWYHLAVSRGVANNIMFVNGTVIDTDADSTDIVDTTELRIGVNDSTANDFAGLLDNIRISKGVARYTATFNPPEWRTGGNKIMWVI